MINNINAINRFINLRTHILKSTQKSLAKSLDASQSTISRTENGSQGISYDLLNRLKSVYGVNPDWIEYGSGEIFISLAANNDIYKDLLKDILSLEANQFEFISKFISMDQAAQDSFLSLSQSIMNSISNMKE
jgi:transcriptional regulator with XRE-family HTH domain